jgi:hypothetical protein
LFARRYHAVKWWVAGVTVVGLGLPYCPRVFAAANPRHLLAIMMAAGIDLILAALVNVIVFGGGLAAVLAAIDMRRNR